MWMMGYNDGVEFNNMPDSFNSRKLRPLIPKSPTTHNTAATNPPAGFGRIHGSNHLLAFNHHLATMSEQSKRELSTQQQVVVSSRWNPTPEQLQTLEELYRRGTRTPSAEQIQHITAQLRRYGKIEGKNVFYWFQNHKARERQKRRRQLESASDHEQYSCDLENTDQKKEPGANRTGLEGEETKNWVHLTNCSAHTDQKTVSLQIRAAKAAAAVPPECRTGTDGWIQFDERELQHRRSLVERNATWQMMHLSSCSPPTYLINTNTISSTATTTTTAIPVTTMDPNIINTTQDLNIFTSPAYRDEVLNHILNGNHSDHSGQVNLSCGESHETLQLFPLRSGNGDENGSEKEAGISGADMNANYTPYQFFEFLPLKN